MYRNDKFEEKFPKKERGTLEFQTELSFDAANGAGEEWISVFDQEDGVLRFDHYRDVEVSHDKVLYDEQFTGSENYFVDNFRAHAQRAFDAKAHARCLTASDRPRKRKADGVDGDGDRPEAKR